MTPSRADLRRKVLDDPEEFIGRLDILDKGRRKRPFSPMWEETRHFLRAGLLGPRKFVLAVKPRQVAYTTVTTAFEFWKGYTSAHGHVCAQVAHHHDAIARLREMVEVFHDGLPPSWRAGFGDHNDNITRYRHNKGGFNRILAGASGQGRTWSFQDAHLTEAAFYPSATAASGRDASGGADEQVWTSILVTLDEGSGDERVIVESTGNGPRGLFYQLWRQAQVDPEWSYIFLPWTSVKRYARPVEDRDTFLATLDADELALYQQGLTAEQLAWRRYMLTTKKYKIARFRREFPRTDADAFLGGSSGWIDQDAIAKMLGWIAPDAELARDFETVDRIFHPPGCGCGCGTSLDDEFYAGFDPSGGVGRDSWCLQVFRHDLLQVATVASRRGNARAQANAIARAGALFGADAGKPGLLLVEANGKGGKDVLARLREMGPGCGWRLWTREDGRDFHSTGWNSGGTKREAWEWAREIIEQEETVCEDVLTLLQMQGLVERPNGNIEASTRDGVELEQKDDHANAYALGLFCARDDYRRLYRRVIPLESEHARRARAVRERFDPGASWPRR